VVYGKPVVIAQAWERQQKWIGASIDPESAEKMGLHPVVSRNSIATEIAEAQSVADSAISRFRAVNPGVVSAGSSDRLVDSNSRTLRD
jgi:hypothetical protein